MNRKKMLTIAMSAAVAAGNILNDHSNDFLKASSKESFRDIVTEVDKYAENEIIKILKMHDSSIPFLSEESRFIEGINEKDYQWIVDALDGTVNYVNHIPFYAVSIALMEKGRPVVGVIYNPMLGDLYYGAEGIGVYKNHAKIKIRDGKEEETLFAVAFSGKNYDPLKRSKEFLMFGKVNDSTRGCLRTGSAAMNLAYLTEGKFGGCWGKANKIWDVAAGILLAKLAGAVVEYKTINKEKNLISYIAVVPSALKFLKGKVRL